MPNFMRLGGQGHRRDGRRRVVWILLLVAGILAARVQGVIKGGSDGVPGSPSVMTIERAVEGRNTGGHILPVPGRGQERALGRCTIRRSARGSTG